MPQKLPNPFSQQHNFHPLKIVMCCLFQGSPVEPGAGGPPTYGTDSASPPSYDEATGWSL